MKRLNPPAVRQMELNLPRPAYPRSPVRRQRRLPGAQWWFQQMRQVVLNTPEWRPPVHPLPAQGELAEAAMTAMSS